MRFIEPFSPTLMLTSVPDAFVEIANRAADNVLADPELRRQLDRASRLIGKVTDEFELSLPNEEERHFIIDTLKSKAVDYVTHMMAINRAFDWTDDLGHGHRPPTVSDFKIVSNWIVSQYANDYNPWHWHTGDISTVLYLKVPENMHDDTDDHFPINGKIEFGFGDKNMFRWEHYNFDPKVGMLVMFPSYLRHTVYPFKCAGERRSMSLNMIWNTET